MTTKAPKSASLYQLPDPPKHPHDKMTAFNHLAANGSAYLLIQHLGKPETTLVGGDHYMSPVPTTDITGLRFPDLLVAFGVDPAAYYQRNAYIISEQGKAPDFVMEIASRSSGRIDVVDKREYYAELGIPEYWRFDETGEFHGTRLAGDQLVDVRYEALPIQELSDGVLQGYSAVLNLNLRWNRGTLEWYDPDTGLHIATLEDERSARVHAEARAETAETRAVSAETRAETAETRAETAETRVHELEEEIRRLRGS